MGSRRKTMRNWKSTLRLSCSHCLGVGIIQMVRRDDRGCVDVRYPYCDRCNGTGSVRECDLFSTKKIGAK